MAFGRDLFGEGPFGRSDFARKVVYESIPAEQRLRDQQNGASLERVLSSLEEELDYQVESAVGLATLRRPLEVRGFGLTETLLIDSVASVVDPDHGPAFNLSVSSSTPIDLLEPSWKANIGGVDYRVVRVVSRDAVQHIVVIGASVPVIAVATSVVFSAPSLLPYLAGDFGLTLDNNEPEFSQRSVIKNVVKYLSWKGAAKGYEIRGSVAGFDVVATGLYAVDVSLLSSLPASRTYRFTIGGVERYYTDIEPVMPHWDDYPADDPVPGIDADMDAVMFEDTVFSSGRSPALDYWLCRFVVDVVSVSVMSPADRAASGLADGYRVRAQLSAAEYALINWTTDPAVFAIVDVDGVVRYIDHVFSWDGVSTIEFAVGVVTDAVSIALGQYCVRYVPRRESLCMWCKSHVITVSLEATDEVLAFYSGDPVELGRAAGRLIANFESVIPIHVRVGQYAVRVTTEIPIDVPVSGIVANEVVIADVLFDMVWDVLDDEDDLDSDTSVIVVYEP